MLITAMRGYDTPEASPYRSVLKKGLEKKINVFVKIYQTKGQCHISGTNSFCSRLMKKKNKGGDFYLLNVKLNRVLINKALNPLYLSNPLTNSSSAMGL